MKNVLKSLLFFSIIGFVFVNILNNKDVYDRLYDKYSKDSSFHCKISKCTSESHVNINNTNFSLTRDLNLNDKAYYFRLKSNDISFNGSYNMIEEKEIMSGVELPIQITFILNIGDNHYTGIYYVSNHNLSLNPTYNNHDYSNYMQHMAFVEKICEYIVNEVNKDLET